MQEFKDGTFGDIKPFSEFMEKLSKMDEYEVENTKSFHFGTVRELQDIKMKKSLEQRFDDLEKDVMQLKEDKSKPESEYFHLPTTEEIKKYGSKGPMERNMLKIMRGIAQK